MTVVRITLFVKAGVKSNLDGSPSAPPVTTQTSEPRANGCANNQYRSQTDLAPLGALRSEVRLKGLIAALNSANVKSYEPRHPLVSLGFSPSYPIRPGTIGKIDIDQMVKRREMPIACK